MQARSSVAEAEETESGTERRFEQCRADHTSPSPQTVFSMRTGCTEGSLLGSHS